VGSGLAYSNGFPMSIEGSAPSVVQAYAKQYIFNRQQSYVVAQAKEEAHGAGIATVSRQDEVAMRTASLFLDAERAGRTADMARKQADSLDKVAQSIKSQVDEGRLLPIEIKKAALNLARIRQLVAALEADQESRSRPGVRRNVSGYRPRIHGRRSRPRRAGGPQAARDAGLRRGGRRVVHSGE
jgi:hypothetical protein